MCCQHCSQSKYAAYFTQTKQPIVKTIYFWATTVCILSHLFFRLTVQSIIPILQIKTLQLKEVETWQLQPAQGGLKFYPCPTVSSLADDRGIRLFLLMGAVLDWWKEDSGKTKLLLLGVIYPQANQECCPLEVSSLSQVAQSDRDRRCRAGGEATLACHLQVTSAPMDMVWEYKRSMEGDKCNYYCTEFL